MISNWSATDKTNKRRHKMDIAGYATTKTARYQNFILDRVFFKYNLPCRGNDKFLLYFHTFEFLDLHL